MKKLVLVLAVIGVMWMPTSVSADLVLRLDVQVTGQGLGAVNTLTTGHYQPEATFPVFESSCVQRINGADVFGSPCNMSGDTTVAIPGTNPVQYMPGIQNPDSNQANGPGGTRTLAELGATSPGDVAVLFNISEKGQDITVNLLDLALRFYSGNTVMYTAYLAPEYYFVALTQESGTGLGGAGFVFALDDAQRAIVNALSGIDRVGGGFNATNVNDGNETMQVFNLKGSEVVPEPASMLLLGSGLLGLGVAARRRKK